MLWKETEEFLQTVDTDVDSIINKKYFNNNKNINQNFNDYVKLDVDSINEGHYFLNSEIKDHFSDKHDLIRLIKYKEYFYNRKLLDNNIFKISEYDNVLLDLDFNLADFASKTNYVKYDVESKLNVKLPYTLSTHLILQLFDLGINITPSGRTELEYINRFFEDNFQDVRNILNNGKHTIQIMVELFKNNFVIYLSNILKNKYPQLKNYKGLEREINFYYIFKQIYNTQLNNSLYTNFTNQHKYTIKKTYRFDLVNNLRKQKSKNFSLFNLIDILEITDKMRRSYSYIGLNYDGPISYTELSNKYWDDCKDKNYNLYKFNNSFKSKYNENLYGPFDSINGTSQEFDEQLQSTNKINSYMVTLKNDIDKNRSHEISNNILKMQNIKNISEILDTALLKLKFPIYLNQFSDKFKLCAYLFIDGETINNFKDNKDNCNIKQFYQNIKILDYVYTYNTSNEDYNFILYKNNGIEYKKMKIEMEGEESDVRLVLINSEINSLIRYSNLTYTLNEIYKICKTFSEDEMGLNSIVIKIIQNQYKYIMEID